MHTNGNTNATRKENAVRSRLNAPALQKVIFSVIREATAWHPPDTQSRKKHYRVCSTGNDGTVAAVHPGASPPKSSSLVWRATAILFRHLRGQHRDDPSCTHGLLHHCLNGLHDEFGSEWLFREGVAPELHGFTRRGGEGRLPRAEPVCGKQVPMLLLYGANACLPALLELSTNSSRDDRFCTRVSSASHHGLGGRTGGELMITHVIVIDG